MSERGQAYIAGAIVAVGSAALLWQPLAEQLERERNQAFAALATAQSRAEGLLLVVEELRTHMVRVIDMGTSGGGWIDLECVGCGATWFGAPDADQVIVHAPDCILAHAPEARGAELLAVKQGGGE